MSAIGTNAETARDQQETSLRDICSVLFRHKGKSILFFVVVVFLVTAGTFIAPEVFESEAKLLVKPGRESIALDPMLPEGRIISIDRTMEEQLRSEVEILKSRLLAERVVSEIGVQEFLRRPDDGGAAGEGESGMRKAATGVLYSAEKALSNAKTTLREWLAETGLVHELNPHDKVIGNVMDSLRADALRNTNILYVTFESRSPELAHRTLEALIDAYLAHHLEVYQSTGSYEFFRNQTNRLREELEAAEAELREFKNSVNIANFDEQRTQVINRLSELEARAQDVAAQRAASAATAAYLERKVAELPSTVIKEELTGAPYYYLDDARFRLLELQLQEKELLSQYPESNRLVKSVRERIRQAEQSVAGEPKTRTETKTGVSEVYQDLQFKLFNEKATLAALEEGRKKLDEQFTAVESGLKVLNDHEMDLARLERHRDITEKNYRNYADRLEGAKASQALEMEKISNIAIVQPATVPVQAIKPRKAINIAIGLLLGLFGGIGLAFLSEYFDHSFRTGEQVEKRLGVPVLVSIPKSRKLKKTT